MGMKVESVLKIEGQEVEEICEIESLRFYESKGGDSVYIANPKGDVIARIDADCGQNQGYIGHIKDMVKNKTVHGSEGY